MPDELVSVCIPCYNVERYLPRLLDSLECQTYGNLEIIFVNDGSSDGTVGIIRSYIPRFDARGYRTKLIHRENGGLAAAVNDALKEVTGEYFIWPDPDDWLTSDSIEKRVRFLQSHPDAAMVRCNMEHICEETFSTLKVEEPIDRPAHIIQDFARKLVSSNTWFGPVSCMMRMSSFEKANGGREIYVSRPAGQNWQLLLPVAFVSECWQMPDVAAYYLVRRRSHSHIADDYATRMAYLEMCYDVMSHVMQSVKGLYESLGAEMTVHHARKRFELALTNRDYARMRREWKLMCRSGAAWRERVAKFLKCYALPLLHGCSARLRTKSRSDKASR